MGRVLSLMLLIVVVGCEREARRYREQPSAVPFESATATDLVAGSPGRQQPAPSPYQENAYGIAEGKRLYSAFNCNGCHAQGGGGIGPALMDEKWIYGSAPDQIYSTIAQGRPNGMPSFARLGASQQLWQLVAYVQTLSMQVPRDAAPDRSDDLNGITPELRLEPKPPRMTGHR